MVSVRKFHLLKDQLDVDRWITTLGLNSAEQQQLLKLMDYCDSQVVQSQASGLLLDRGVEMVSILATLNMNLDTLKAAILFPFVEAGLIGLDWVEREYGKRMVDLLHGVLEMEGIRSLHGSEDHDQLSDSQIDNLRRMLLAMVEDVRAVVIKLAERISFLREVKHADEETRVLIAKEISNIYAPLANRLGIGQLKWELEDLAFRYLHPDTYKRIAKLLDEKRIDRERYINEFVAKLRASLQEAGIKADVYGRPKHIYSIWRKMQKKNLDFSELFDVRAVRVITDRLQDCYAALGVVHTNWKHIPREFDDYVANPKPNGYQSIHTVVLGAEGKTVEIQIRTRQMHEDAELGVAAHWKYKEGAVGGRAGGYEEKIAWLRKLLQWQDDMAESGNLVDELRSQVFEDRVYVFTPKGEVVDLPQGSTPLDFAYYIHSQIGHRCIGAKVGGRIVPFTYQLQTGDQVEIITQKEPNPSRDWLNPNLGYVRSSRARSKISTWFKKQDRDKNLIAGKEMLEAELHRVGLHLADVEKHALTRFNMASLDDLLAAIGGGDVRVNQVVNHLQSRLQKPSAEQADRDALEKLKRRAGQQPQKVAKKGQIVIQGIGNLMTHIARCCQPVPGDKIEGFITQGRGISIHREDCEQLKELSQRHPERVVDAVWGENYSGGYTLTVRVVANDRSGLLRDITTILANDKVNVLAMRSRSDVKEQLATIDMDMEIYNLDTLGRVLSRINQVPDVIEARRLL